jgi:N,N'-diacetyllegionaminate synthase
LKTIKFGNRQIGDGQPTFITYEAGPTHDGLESAKALISMAAEAGADAIKFQMFDPDRLVADRKMLFEYEVLVDRESGRMETVSEPLYDILCRRTLSVDEWRECKTHADSNNLAFFSTVGFEEEVQLVEELGCDSIKIASGDVTHFPLIRSAARTGLCLQLDTGNSTIGEIESAVDVIRSQGNENIIIHHCPSGYPARADGINLRVIETLKQMFPYPIAFSDHSPGWEMDIAAISLGANLIEKTISQDRTTRSVEHVMSIEPPHLREFINVIRSIETALGTKRRLMSADESQNRLSVHRSIHVREDTPAGTRLCDAQLEYRRPGDGLAPSMLDQLGSSIIRTNLPAGHKIMLIDLD